MISLDDALYYIGTDKGEVKERTIKRLRGEDTIHVGSRWLDEHPADVLIPLLEQDSYPEIRNGVLEGWMQVYEGLSSHPEPAHVCSLCWVAELTRAPELEGRIKELLQTALSKGLHLKDKDEDFDAMYEIISARRAYPLTEEDSAIAIQLIKYERFAAIAFDLLLKINPDDKRIEDYLFELCCRHYEQGWRTDITYAAAGVIDCAKEKHIENLLRRVKEEKPLIWPKLEKEFRELDLLGEKESSS